MIDSEKISSKRNGRKAVGSPHFHLNAEQFQLQTMTLPAIILCFIFSYIPMYGIVIAFKDYSILSTMTTAPFAEIDSMMF